MKTLSIFIAALSVAAIAHAAPKTGELVMTGPNSGEVQYIDKCANGANNDVATEDKFVKAMLSDSTSTLSQLRAQIIKDEGDDTRGEGFYLSDIVRSYHDRDGCGSSHNSFSVIAFAVTGGNSNHTVAKFLVNIDDDDNEGTRTLKLNSVQPLQIRDEK